MSQINPPPRGAQDLSHQIQKAKQQIQQSNPTEVKALTGGERLPHVDPKIQQTEEKRDLITGQVLNAETQRNNNAALLRTIHNIDPTGLPNQPKSDI